MRATADHVIVLDADRVATDAGILLPETAKRIMHRAQVESAGPGSWNKKRTLKKPLDVRAGDIVHYLAMNSDTLRPPGRYVLAHDNILLLGEDGSKIEFVGRYGAKPKKRRR